MYEAVYRYISQIKALSSLHVMTVSPASCMVDLGLPSFDTLMWNAWATLNSRLSKSKNNLVKNISCLLIVLCFYEHSQRRVEGLLLQY